MWQNWVNMERKEQTLVDGGINMNQYLLLKHLSNLKYIFAVDSRYSINALLIILQPTILNF